MKADGSAPGVEDYTMRTDISMNKQSFLTVDDIPISEVAM